MKKKTIRVTDKDILTGVRQSWCECPVAMAVKRAFRTARTNKPVHVPHEVIAVGDLEETQSWFAETPGVVQRFITRFDAGKRVKPFSFTADFR